MGSDESAGDFHRRLIEGNILTILNLWNLLHYAGCLFQRTVGEIFSLPCHRGTFTEQVKMMKFSYSSNLQEAINHVSQKMPKADVAIFPSGGNIIPDIR
jgi:hypothetical protein